MYSSTTDSPPRPDLMPWADQGTRRDLYALIAGEEVVDFVDAFTPSLTELFAIEHPDVLDQPAAAASMLDDFLVRARDELEPASMVAVLPWKRAAVHLPDPDTYFKLRTARNHPLISHDEQLMFRDATVAIAGMSVGFSVLQQLVLSGGPRRLRICDPDHLSIPNLNRLLHSVCEVGLRKCELAMRRVYELDPFADITAFDDGVTNDNLRDFLAPAGRPVDIVFDEVDHMHTKFSIRKAARELRIPVVMVTDQGDCTTVDVERFDLEPERPLFHGRLSEDIINGRGTSLSREERLRIAAAICSPSDMPPRFQSSFEKIGVCIPAWPQLGNTASAAGSAGSYVARRILTGADMPSGRYVVSFDGAFDPNWNSPEAIGVRARATAQFAQWLGVSPGTCSR